MARLVVFFSLATTTRALTCVKSSGEDQDCSMDGKDGDGQVESYVNFCYVTPDSAGCLPAQYKTSVVYDASKADCWGKPDGCYCLTDKCNTAEWFTSFKASWTPPPMCWTGLAGSNEGPTCSSTSVFTDNKYEKANCYARSLSKKCVENNKHIGMGDGCSDYSEQAACEAHEKDDGDEKRKTEESFDGSDRWCRWIPELTAAKAECEKDDECTYQSAYSSCSSSDKSNARERAWKEKLGQPCEGRPVVGGCFSTEGYGLDDEDSRCTVNEDETSCNAVKNDCPGRGVCTGTPNPPEACDKRFGAEHDCTENGNNNCMWKRQCCRWLPTIVDKEDACKNNGKGTLDGLCEYDANSQSCGQSQLYRDSQKHHKSCSERAISNQCVENNKYVGRGDGCVDKTDQAGCEGAEPSRLRSASDSFDGSTRHCRWIPAKNTLELQAACHVDDQCTFYEDRGENGECASSDLQREQILAWEEQRGLECSQRMIDGCVENNAHMGMSPKCTANKDEQTCIALANDCWEGTCSGQVKSRTCEERSGSRSDCTSGRNGRSSGCSYTEQCCNWKPPVEAPADSGATHRAGTLAGVCAYNDGHGPPGADLISTGFGYGLFTLRDRFQSNCALVASFRKGKGS